MSEANSFSSAAEHVFADSRIIIREDEPTSIIAFTLSSRTHRDKLRNVAHQHRSAKKAEDFMPDEVTTERTSAWDVLSLDEAVEAEDPTRGDAGTHLKYGMSDSLSLCYPDNRQILKAARPQSSAGFSSLSSLPLFDRLVDARTASLSLLRDVSNGTLRAERVALHSSKPRVGLSWQ